MREGVEPERVEMGDPCWLLKLRWMGTQREQMKEVLSWLVHWTCRAGTRDFCSALAAPLPSRKYCLLTIHYFNSFVPNAQQAGQVAVLGRLSLSVCLWLEPTKRNRIESQHIQNLEHWVSVVVSAPLCDEICKALVWRASFLILHSQAEPNHVRVKSLVFSLLSV